MCTALCNSFSFFSTTRICVYTYKFWFLSHYKSNRCIKKLLQSHFLFVCAHAIFNVGFFNFINSDLFDVIHIFYERVFWDENFWKEIYFVVEIIKYEVEFRWHRQLCHSWIATMYRIRYRKKSDVVRVAEWASL